MTHMATSILVFSCNSAPQLGHIFVFFPITIPSCSNLICQFLAINLGLDSSNEAPIPITKTLTYSLIFAIIHSPLSFTYSHWVDLSPYIGLIFVQFHVCSIRFVRYTRIMECHLTTYSWHFGHGLFASNTSTEYLHLPHLYLFILLIDILKV